MIAEAFAVLVHYGIYLLPGLILFGLWFGLTPKTLPGLRIVILLLAFVLMRDAMTPLGMWSLSREVQIEFTANPWVLAGV